MEKEDFLHTLVCLCLEANQKKLPTGTFQSLARRKIGLELAKRKRENGMLYCKYRNLYLDKCYAESRSPLLSWMDFSDYLDWQ